MFDCWFCSLDPEWDNHRRSTKWCLYGPFSVANQMPTGSHEAMREILVAGDTNRLVAELTFAPWILLFWRGRCRSLEIWGRLDRNH